MSSRVSAALIFAVLGASGPVALGAFFAASLNNEGSTTLHEVTISPGGTFAMDINLSMDTGSWLLGTHLEASASSLFTITSFTYLPPFNTAGWYTEAPLGELNPGGSVFHVVAPEPGLLGPGDFTIGTAIISASPMAPVGTYTLNVSNILTVGSPAETSGGLSGTPGPDFLVTITPEPVSGLLLGSLLLAAFRRSAISARHRRA